MRWSIRIFLLVGSIALVTPPVLAALYVVANKGFGSGDLRPFTIWSAFFAVFVAAFAPAVLGWQLARRRVVRVPVAAVLGVLAGVIFTIVVALTLGPWVGAFSVPILYLWAAGGALALGGVAALPPASDAPIRPAPRLRRVLGIGALVLLCAAAFPFVMLYGSIFIWDRAEHEVHLLPAGYEGPVLIIYGDTNGAPERREGKARLYEIPPGGVLRTRFAPNSGWGAPQYFYVDSLGHRTLIGRGSACSGSHPNNAAQVCGMGQLYMSNRTGPIYTGYVVSRAENRRALDARGDSLVRALVYGDSTYLPR